MIPRHYANQLGLTSFTGVRVFCKEGPCIVCSVQGFPVWGRHVLEVITKFLHLCIVPLFVMDRLFICTPFVLFRLDFLITTIVGRDCIHSAS